MDNFLVTELNNRLTCGWLEKLAAHTDGGVAEIKKENFDYALQNKDLLFNILRKGLSDTLINEDEKTLYDNVIYMVYASFKNKNYERMGTIYHSLIEKLSLKQKTKLISDNSINISNYYDELILSDVDSVSKILSSCNFGEEHDKYLISRLKTFFYRDSEELRLLIYEHPSMYDKLAKIGNKPNFPNEVLKELVYVHGSKYFVSRLHDSLKDDEEFMSHIIIEDPFNIFRGRTKDFKHRIRENAFFLFGDTGKKIFDVYGMEYIFDHSDVSFINWGEFLKYNSSIPKFMHAKIQSLVSDDEYRTLLLRGALPSEFYESSPFFKTENFKLLLNYNFKNMGYKCDDKVIESIDKKYKDILSGKRSVDSIMRFANNVVASYVNGTTPYFDLLCDGNQDSIAFSVDMSIFSKNIIEKLGTDNLKRIAYYPNSLYILSQVIKEGSFEVFSHLLEKQPSSSLAPAVDVNVLLYSTYMYKDAIIDLVNKGQLSKDNVAKVISITKNNKLLKIENCEDVVHYEDNLKKFCDERIKNCTDANYAKEMLFARILKTNRASAQDLIIKYKEGLELNASFDAKILELLEIIDSLSSVDAIKDAYKTLVTYDLFKSKSFDEIDSHLKREVTGDTFIGDKPIEAREKKGSIEEYLNLYGAEVIVPTAGSPINVLVHVVGAYGTTPDKDSIYDSWNTSQRENVSGICTSLITNKYVSTAPIPKDSIILGFKDVACDEVLMCAPYDIYSRSARLTPDSLRSQNYIDSNNMPDHCRGAAGDYSEVVISRYCNGQKRQPDYVVLFDYQWNNAGLSASIAKQFDIPVLYIDTRALFQENYADLSEKIENLTNEPNLELAKDIIVQWNTIKHGFKSVPEGHLGPEFANIKNKETKLLPRIIEQKLSSVGKQLSDSDMNALKEFAKNESKKEKCKNYAIDREETVKKGKKKASLSLFNELRKEYGVREGLKMMKMQNLINSMVSYDDSNIYKKEVDGGSYGGKK